ncbi:MAG: ABC transporter substrate-binding protein [Polyangiaceae bacterium]
MRRREFLAGAIATALALRANRARANATVRVLVPDPDNLQYMSFWLAKALFFQGAGIDAEIVSPPIPQQALAWIEDKKPDAAVLPPPMYLELVANRAPWVLGANLLANDPIDLVVRRSVADARGITRELPIRERLEKLRGVKIGIAPHPPPRLRELYKAVGLDAAKDATLVTIHGKAQNDAFQRGDVDALYAHTPYLEKALVHQDAVLVVYQNGGEVKELANRQIHALTFSRTFLNAHHEDAQAMVSAVARAETILRTTPGDAVAPLQKAFPERDPAEIDSIVHLYSPAIPATPKVSTDGFAPAVLFFPEGEQAPNLDGIDLASFVAPELSQEKPADGSPKIAYAGGAVALVALAALALKLRSGRPRDPSEAQK